MKKSTHTFDCTNQWDDAPIRFNWSGDVFVSVKDAKKTLKSLKQAIKDAKKSKK